MVSKMSNGFSTKKRVPVIWGAPWGRPCPERPQVKQHELETTEELESQGWLVHGCRGTNNDHLWWCVGVVCHSRRFVTSSSMTSTDFHIFRVRLLFCNQDLHRRLDGGKHLGLCEDGGNLDPSFQTNPSRTKCDRFLRLYPWNLKKMIRADESWWKLMKVDESSEFLGPNFAWHCHIVVDADWSFWVWSSKFDGQALGIAWIWWRGNRLSWILVKIYVIGWIAGFIQ